MSENQLYAVLLRTDDLHPQIIVSSVFADVLPMARKFIDCDTVQVVKAAGIKHPYRLLVDEEGLFKDKPVLNFLASYLYGTHHHGQPIVGNAIIVAERVLPTGDHDLRLLTKKEAEDARFDLEYVALAAYKLIVAKMEQSGMMQNKPPHIDKNLN